jgi:heptosyltransferase-3
MSFLDRTMPDPNRVRNPNEKEEQELRGEGPLRILIVRPDRIGDVVLSTPVFEVIQKAYPRAHLTALVQESVLPLLRTLPTVNHFLLYDPRGVHAGVRGFFRLVTEIRRRRFRIAIILQDQWRVSLAVFLAGVLYRVGPWSKPLSFFLFNRGLRQRRSHVEMHEADYNLQLLRKLGLRFRSRHVPTRIAVAEETQARAVQWLESLGWRKDLPLILVHPGMGGSALNWPESHYVELIQQLLEKNYQVLITAGPTENHLLDRFEKLLPPATLKSVFRYRSRPAGASVAEPVDFYAALCGLSQVVVAPSTGPLHMAVAMGRPVVTFFPPIRVQSAVRWGPYLEDETRASVLVPEVYCGQERQCLGAACHYFPCMNGILVQQALAEVERQVERSVPPALEASALEVEPIDPAVDSVSSPVVYSTP